MLSQSKSPGPDFFRTGLWQKQDGAGLERFELLSTLTGWVLRGTILVMDGSEPAEARYQIHCDSSWRTKGAEISLYVRGRDKALNITTEKGFWYENGKPNESVSGCIDIDLAWSPSTNTLPIRRLNLAVGESSGVITAAWVVFPDLRLQPLDQEYKYVGNRRYSYTSHKGSFHAELLVDEDGLVVNYAPLWHRLDRAARPETQPG